MNGNPGLNAAKATITWTVAATVPVEGAMITVKGFDQGLVRPMTEQILLRRGTAPVNAQGVIAINDEVTTQQRFAEITSITPSGFTTPGSIKVDIDPTEYYRHTLEVGDSLLNGMSVEMVKGVTPNLYRDVHIGEATYTIGDTNEISMTLQGGRGDVGVNAEDGGPAPSSLLAQTTPVAIPAKTRPPGLSAPGFGTIFRLNDMVIRVGEGSISLNHSLGQDGNSFAREVFRPSPIQTANRVVSLSARMSYPAQLTDGTEISTADLNAYAWGQDIETSLDAALLDFGEAHNSMKIELPTGRMTAFPDPPDLAQGQINNPIEIAGYAKGANPDLRVVVTNNETTAQFIV